MIDFDQIPFLEDDESYRVFATLLNASDAFKVILDLIAPVKNSSIDYAERNLIQKHPRTETAFDGLRRHDPQKAYRIQPDMLRKYVDASTFHIMSVQEKLQEMNSTNADASFKSLHKRFGKNVANFTFSVVGFSDGGRFALCSMSYASDSLAGFEAIQLLQKDINVNQWQKMDAVDLWIS